MTVSQYYYSKSIEYTTDTISLYHEDTLIGTSSHNVGFPTNLEFHTGANRFAIIKDLKVNLL